MTSRLPSRFYRHTPEALAERVLHLCCFTSSSSKSANTTSTTTNTQETNLYQTGSGDLGIANSSGVNVTLNSVDEGAVADATALGQAAIQSNTNVALGAESNTTQALNALTQTQTGSFAAVEQALNDVTSISENSNTLFGNLASTAQGAEASNASAALTQVANATSSQVASLTQTKYVLVAVGVIAGLAILAYAYAHRKG